MFSYNKQKGIGLVEVLISLVLSVLVIGAVLRLFADAQSSYNNQRTVSAVTVDGSYFLDVIANDIKHAGYADYGFSGSPVLLNESNENGLIDSITIVYKANVQDTATVTCLGDDVYTAVTNAGLTINNAYVGNKYYIRNNDELACQAYLMPAQGLGYDSSLAKKINSEQTLMSNVAALNTLYGVEVEFDDTTKDNEFRYYKINSIPVVGLGIKAVKIKAIKIALLLHSEQNARESEIALTSQTYTLLDSDFSVPESDQRKYMLFEKNLMLRNTEEPINRRDS